MSDIEPQSQDGEGVREDQNVDPTPSTIEERIFRFMDEKFAHQMEIIKLHHKQSKKSKHTFAYQGNEFQHQFNDELQEELKVLFIVGKKWSESASD